VGYGRGSALNDEKDAKNTAVCGFHIRCSHRDNDSVFVVGDAGQAIMDLRKTCRTGYRRYWRCASGNPAPLCHNKLHSRSHKEYMTRKRRAYNEAISSFDRGFALHTDSAIASNCGKILTKASDNEIKTRSIRWIIGVGE
jgi:hypothetical protein